MNFTGTDLLTQLAFSVSENKGVFAVLIGSGLSRAADIPTGWEITLDLIRRFAAAQGVVDQEDWAKWYHETTGEQPNYSIVLESLAMSPTERRAVVHSYIEPSEQDRKRGLKKPTPAHVAIAELVASGYVRVIVTTNFDRLMENALRERGVEPTVVASVDALSGAEPITHTSCYILKLNGDYKDARLLNTDVELDAYPKKIDDLLDRIFDEHGLIISGWSGEWDVALRKAMMRAPNRRYPVYWTARGGLRDHARDLAKHRDAQIIEIVDANTVFRTLRDRVQTLEEARRVNPRSVELTVATAKRFLGSPKPRIEFDELISQEADRLIDQINDPALSTQERRDDRQAFRNRVATYEAATETVARIAGVLGRWGDDSQLNVVCDLLRTLYAQADSKRNAQANGKRTDLPIWINLPFYPAVLVAAAYALGLMRERRIGLLHVFLTSQITCENGEALSFASALSTVKWKGLEGNIWTRLEGRAQDHIAFSGHIFDLFKHWGKSFVGLAADFEVVFDRFELLESLAFFEQNLLAELEDARTSRPRKQFAPTPIGRVGWRSPHYPSLTRELQADPMKSLLLNAGFAKGSPRMLELFVESLGYSAETTRW